LFAVACIAAVMLCWLARHQPSTAQASSTLNIVYPSDGARVPFLKREFIFGSAAPGSKVSVNGASASVEGSGAWIAFVPLTPGAFRFRVVARVRGETTSTERVIYVAAPPRTTPSTPAKVDLSVAPAPYVDMAVRTHDIIRLFVKASVGARVSASFGGSNPLVRLHPAKLSELSASENTHVLHGAFASEVTVNGLYVGALRIPASARGVLHVHYTVAASDGSTARAAAKGKIDVAPLGWYRVGSIVPGDHNKDIDARPFGVVESEPHGDWLFSSPANTRFDVTGSAGDYYRVALSSDQNGWIAKHSLQLLPPDTPRPSVSVRDIELRDEERWGIATIRLTARMPFWVEELPKRPGLRVHIYGAIGSIGLNRDGAADSNIAALRWTRKKDGTAAVDIALRQRTLWGYRAQWNGDDLELAIKRPPVLALSPAPALQGLVIVVDPGHSPDIGARGPLGTQERDINLAIAKLLATHLESLGARAVLTRTANVAVGLYDRPAFAAEQSADILISVHNNALPDGTDPFTHHGFSVYYFRPQSLALATAIHDAYRRNITIPDEGLYKDELALTRATEEPAVLTESAFIMWPSEESLLRDPAFQDKVAGTIAEGVRDWVAAMRTKETTPAPNPSRE
jgi:N-acetylmuramoyl-L-alanine amidase